MTKNTILLFFYCISFSVFATNYYVSNSGDDSNDGLSKGTAWQTLSKVESMRSTFFPGDIIAFNGGDEWYGGLNIGYAPNGTTTNPITYTSYGVGQAEITGAEAITGWTNTSGNIWEASTVGKTVYNVMKGEDLQMNARYPNLVTDLLPEDNLIQVTSVTSQTNIVVNGLLGLTDLVGANLIILTSDWLVEQVKITAYSSSTGELTLDATDIGNLEGVISSGDNCFVNNHYNLLSQNREWHYDPTANKLYLYSVGSPTDINICTSNLDGILSDNNEYYVFDNLKVIGFNKAGINFSDGNKTTVKNCTILNNRLGGTLSWNGDGNIIHNNTFIGNASRSIQNAHDCTITNNIIIDNGVYSKRSYTKTLSTDLEGIITGRAATIEYNTLFNIGYHGINVGRVSTVRFNKIENTCLSAEDGGAIYFDNELADGSIVEKNILIANPYLTTTWGSQGVYLDENTTGIACDKNTIKGFKFNVQIHVAGGSTFTNNNLYKSIASSFRTSDKNFSSDVVNMTITGNNIYLENVSEYALKISNTDDSNYNIGILDNNEYWNPLNTDDIHVYTTETINDGLTVVEWNNLSGEDANSGSDLGTKVLDSQLVYNDSMKTLVISLIGTWYDLDDTSYSGRITLAAWTGKILIRK